MSFLTLLFRSKGAKDLHRAMKLLKKDKWDEALEALNEANKRFDTLSRLDKSKLLCAIAIVNRAVGMQERALGALQQCRCLDRPGSRLSEFLDHLMGILSRKKPDAPTPFAVGGKPIPEDLYIAKEMLLAGIETRHVDPALIAMRYVYKIQAARRRAQN